MNTFEKIKHEKARYNHFFQTRKKKNLSIQITIICHSCSLLLSLKSQCLGSGELAQDGGRSPDSQPCGQSKGLVFANHDLRAAATFLPCRMTTSSILIKFNIISARGSGTHTTNPNILDSYCPPNHCSIMKFMC